MTADDASASVPPTSRDDEHRRPEGVTDALVAATGKASEAFEWVERLRGRLFDFHQMMGHADFLFGDAADALEQAGQPELAEMLRRDVVGRNVLPGRWTFQIIEEFDDGYYRVVKDAEERIQSECMQGRRHVFEAELKARRQAR